MSFPFSLRLGLVGLGSVLSFVACSSAPLQEEAGDETSESALNGCGHLTPGGVLVGQAPNACVPGSKEYTSAGCAQPNGRRVHTCDAGCRWGAFSATCDCQPTSCAGRICGGDGCGGSCGTCPGHQQCSADGTKCLGSIAGTSSGGSGGGGGGGGGGGSCFGKSCGPDGAGGTCGSCPLGSTCNGAGSCVAPAPSCKANADSCFVDSQCCSDLCYSGTATCVACLPSTTLAYCNNDGECCSKLCDTYTLSCVNTCKAKTSACKNNGQCCSGHCTAGSCL